MRAIQIAVLSLVMRWLQAWTQSLSRRLAIAQRATNSQPIHARVRPPQARPTTDDRTTDVPQPPADWLDRTTPTQPPARWLTMVHKRTVEPSASAETITTDHRTATNAEPTQFDVSNQPQPMQSASSAMSPAKPIATVDQSALTKPLDTTHRSTPSERSEQAPIVPQRRQITRTDEDSIEAEPSALQVFDNVPSNTSMVENEALPVQEPSDLPTANARNTQSPDRPAERSRPVLQSTVFETPWAEPRLHSTQTATFDSVQEIDLAALRSSAFQRSIEPADDRREVRLNSAAVSGSPQTWATFARADQVAPEVAAVENLWPTLLDEPRTPNEDVEVVLRDWERLRRLDLEQRGLGWSV